MVATCGGTPNDRTTPITKGVIADAACSSAHVLQTPGHVRRTGRGGTTPGNTPHAVSSPQENWQVLIGGTTVSPKCDIMGSQGILNKHGSNGSAEIGDTQNFDISIDGNLAENGDSTPISSNIIRQELYRGSSAYIYLRFRVDFKSNAVGTETPDFLHLGIPAFNESNELNPISTPATRFRRPTYGSN